MAVIVHQVLVEDKEETPAIIACDREKFRIEYQEHRQENTTMAKPKPSRNAPEEIDAYLEALAEDRRVALEV